MQVNWKYRGLEDGCGHGVEVHLGEVEPGNTLSWERSDTNRLGFIEGFRWRILDRNAIRDSSLPTTVFLDSKLKKLPKSLTTDIQFAILRFMTDKGLQKEMFMTAFHGFTFWTNG